MRMLATGEPKLLEKVGLTTHNDERLKKTVSKLYGLFFIFADPLALAKPPPFISFLNF